MSTTLPTAPTDGHVVFLLQIWPLMCSILPAEGNYVLPARAIMRGSGLHRVLGAQPQSL